MAADPQADISEAQIAVHWKEEPLIQPPDSFKTQANVRDSSVFERFSEKNFPKCFEEYANLLSWDTK
ncbi:MAG: hypothetical protein KGI26_02975, partial [Thaumarchaeota archaeon]|nr:hypothetical protein [Nitrososphaerota archaeon]